MKGKKEKTEEIEKQQTADQQAKSEAEPEKAEIEKPSEAVLEKTEAETAGEKITELEAQVKELQDKYLRKLAEFENYKRRVENDQFNLITYGAESFIVKLLPVVDDFERSLRHIDDTENSEAIKEGIRLVYEKLLKVLNEQGVKKMESVGKPFDVEYHDALMQRKDETVQPHTVLEEIEPGYIYRDKVIRHARVIVSEDIPEEDMRTDDKSSDDEINQQDK